MNSPALYPVRVRALCGASPKPPNRRPRRRRHGRDPPHLQLGFDPARFNGTDAAKAIEELLGPSAVPPAVAGFAAWSGTSFAGPVLAGEVAAALARDARMRGAMGEAGRRRVLERFTVGRMVSEMEALYLEGLGGRGR